MHRNINLNLLEVLQKMGSHDTRQGYQLLARQVGSTSLASNDHVLDPSKSFYKRRYRLDAPNPDHRTFELTMALHTNYLSFHKFFPTLPLNIGAQSKIGDRRRNSSRFASTEISYLEVELFHDLGQPLS